MFRQFNMPAKLLVGFLLLILFIAVIFISISGNRLPQQKIQSHYIHSNAAADNKVEALKTVTANLLAVQDKNATLENELQEIKIQNQRGIDQLQQQLLRKLKESLKSTRKSQNIDTAPRIQVSLTNPAVTTFIWVSDLSKSNKSGASKTKESADSNFFFVKQSEKKISHFLLSENTPKPNTIKEIEKIRPIYTIPENATLTHAILMTPLIGRIPIDGKLNSPYWFKLVLSANNLTANGYPLPGIQGAVMSGVASGDMLGSCVRGDIRSMTFIFTDGRISTVDAKGENDTLGYLSSETGNPCIHGSFHSDAAVFLGAQMGLAGVQGYANAISNAQMMKVMTPEGGKISTLIGNATRAGLGQGVSASAQAAQTWWNRRVQNAFDYVFVANVNPKTHRAMSVVVNTTKAIPIDNNPNNRKVSYEHDLQTIANDLD